MANLNVPIVIIFCTRIVYIINIVNLLTGKRRELAIGKIEILNHTLQKSILNVHVRLGIFHDVIILNQ